VDLGEEDFLGGSFFGLPLPDAPFDGPSPLLPVLVGEFAFQPFDKRLGLERRFLPQLLFQLRPDLGERVDASPPAVRHMRFAG
jgi:hypothetical protein